MTMMPAWTTVFLDPAWIHGLLITGGSDYDGTTKPSSN
jgi:hypothetical protein